MMTRQLGIVQIALAILALVGPFAAAVVPPAAAAPSAQGLTPAEAVVLAAEGVSGHVSAGQAVWYRYYPSGVATGQPDRITLIFTPAVELGALVSSVNFHIFSSAQAIGGGDLSALAAIGSGSYVSRDGDPNTAEYLWQGTLPGADAYYVRVSNNTAVDVDSWLFPADVLRVEPASTLAMGAAEAAPTAPGVDSPQYLPSTQPAVGHLEPGKETWYRWVPVAYTMAPDAHVLTMFFTPANTADSVRVGFELMTIQQSEVRQRGQPNLNTGAGAIVSRDGDPVTGERLWRGNLPLGETYLVRINNGSAVPVDFWLYQGDIERTVFDQPSAGVNTEGTALDWKEWHVAVTCVTHCDWELTAM